jgi:hypothetical protein
MVSIKSKHIVIGLAVGFILFLFCRIGADDYSNEYREAQIPAQTQASYYWNESKQAYPSSSIRSNDLTNPTRSEILQIDLKGYREATYWGSEHPLDEEIRYQNEDEFDRFIENVESNDAGVYWGAEY